MNSRLLGIMVICFLLGLNFEKCQKDLRYVQSMKDRDERIVSSIRHLGDELILDQQKEKLLNAKAEPQPEPEATTEPKKVMCSLDDDELHEQCKHLRMIENLNSSGD